MNRKKAIYFESVTNNKTTCYNKETFLMFCKMINICFLSWDSLIKLFLWAGEREIFMFENERILWWD